MKTFSLAEVAKHNKPEDCWVVIRGKVYDVTVCPRISPYLAV
jgi:cytochrome b involved in lipid metabolism